MNDHSESILHHRVVRFGFFLSLCLLSFLLFRWLYQFVSGALFLGLLLSYVLFPIINFFASIRIPRLISVLLLVLFSLTCLILLCLKLIPFVYGEILDLVKLAPVAYEVFIEDWLPHIKEYLLSNNLMAEKDWSELSSGLNVLPKISGRVYEAMTGIWYSAPKLFATAINIALTPFITFFVLKDYEKIVAVLAKPVPFAFRGSLATYFRNINQSLRAILIGQITVAMILAALYVVSLSFLGLKAAVAIGLVAGLCRIVPYLDVIVGLFLSFVVILSDFQGASQIWGVLIAFFVVQLLDGAIITPRIIGQKAGIHPFIVVISVLAFSDLWGFWGILLAVPVLAIIKATIKTLMPVYYKSFIYKG